MLNGYLQLTPFCSSFGRYRSFLGWSALAGVWCPAKVVPSDRHWAWWHGLVFPCCAWYVFSSCLIRQKLPVLREMCAGRRGILVGHRGGDDILVSTNCSVTICGRTRTSVVKEVCRHGAWIPSCSVYSFGIICRGLILDEALSDNSDINRLYERLLCKLRSINGINENGYYCIKWEIIIFWSLFALSCV